MLSQDDDLMKSLLTPARDRFQRFVNSRLFQISEQVVEN